MSIPIAFFFLLFFISILVCCSLPGIILLSIEGRFSVWERSFLGTVLGLVIFSLLSYFLLVIHLDILTIPLVISFDLLFRKKIIQTLKNISLSTSHHLLILTTVFLLGIAGQLAVISLSGLNVVGDLTFWSAHGHDSFWHISIMNELKRGGYPIQNPVFAGERLINYHFFSDIAPAIFNRYLHLPDLDLYFRFFPFLYSLLLGALAFLLGKKLSGSFGGGVWSTIFTYFTGSFGYIVTLIKYHKISGESIFWASQIQSSIGNPPQILSSILLLSFVYLLLVFVESKNKSIFTYCVLIAGSIAVFKVYAAIVLLSSLGLAGVTRVFKDKKFDVLLMTLFSGLLGLILYLPNTANSSSFLIFEPWWFIRTMVVTSNHLDWLDLELRRQTYLSEHNLKRVLQLEMTAFLIFLLGNLGMRIIGFFDFYKRLKSSLKNFTNLILILISLTSFIMPLLFLQKGVAPNTIQFLQYFLLLFGIFAGITTSEILAKIRPLFLFFIISIVIITLSIPTQLGLLYEFYSKPPLAKVGFSELDAMHFIKTHTSPNDSILTVPFNKYLNLKEPTPPIWAWSDTSYLSALTDRRTYLTDTEQVDIMGYSYQDRLKTQREVFDTTDPATFKSLLEKTDSNYLYFPKIQRPRVDIKNTGLTLYYENDEVELWKVR